MESGMEEEIGAEWLERGCPECRRQTLIVTRTSSAFNYQLLLWYGHCSLCERPFCYRVRLFKDGSPPHHFGFDTY